MDVLPLLFHGFATWWRFSSQRSPFGAAQPQRLAQPEGRADCERLKRCEPRDSGIIRNSHHKKQLLWFRGGYLGCAVFC